jgi:hypothetical protein
MGLSEYNVSAKMRDLITSIAESTINKLRPAYRYGACVSVDIPAKRASVLFNGDLDPVNVPIAGVWPRPGQIVRVSGIGTDRFIDGVVGVPETVPILSASTFTEQQAILAAMRPDHNSPVIIHRNDAVTDPYKFRLTTDGVTWLSIDAMPSKATWTQLPYETPWTRYATSYADGGYLKLNTGIVVLKGLVKGGAEGSVIAQLPEGYRPDERMVFETSTFSNIVGRVDVHPNGNIVAVRSDPDWIGLDGIMFPAAGVADWQPLTLVNSWLEYTDSGGSGYGTPSWWQDRLGRVWFRGMVYRGAVPTADSIMAQLPTNLQPRLQLHMPALMTNVGSGVDFARINAAGGDANYPTLRWKRKTTGTNTTTWVSLAGLMYTPEEYEAMTNIPYTNSWASFNASMPAQQYQRHADSLVQLQGLITGGTFPGDSGILPVGARPSERGLYTISSDNQWARVDLFAASLGDIEHMNRTVTSWHSLNGINFVAEA